MKLLVSALCSIIFVDQVFPREQRFSDEDHAKFENAVDNDDVVSFREVLEGRNIHRGGEDTKSPLHYVAEVGHEKVLKELLENEVDVNFADREGLTSVHFAALNPNEKILETIIKHGGNVNATDNKSNTALHIAALNSNEKVAEVLLLNGANIAAFNGENETAFHWSALNTNEKVAELLIKNGAEINARTADGSSPLHNAAFNSNEKVAELLIKHGSNVNSEDNDGMTPIFYAVTNGNQELRPFLETVELSESYSKKKVQEALLKHFTQPLHKDSGEKIVEILVNNGANINRKAKHGKTPYQQSDELGDTKMKELLLKHGAERV